MEQTTVVAAGCGTIMVVCFAGEGSDNETQPPSDSGARTRRKPILRIDYFPFGLLSGAVTYGGLSIATGVAVRISD